MSNSNVYNLCCRYQGKVVRIQDRNGRVHVGEITRVSRDRVWIRPVRNQGGYGYGWYGYGYGYGGFGYGIALGAITGIALAAALFW
ncbi:hypothetical protein [Jeotgalibacillus soli]|uniref:Uncharacterized protein n=1 Tax=Jeotgalibacillus soli TaxID=889306 RepID=A0A0C2VN00_9BACL|nr:hypothetical protein [Jeotgalibacillus soli]KIL45378.1 hypothetical protein KP78_29220 [Jeotgalibacillus soli]